MLENIPTWLPELEKWEHSDYDGIKGSPPEWVPQPHKEKFHKASSRLFFTVEKNKDDYLEIKSHFDKLVADKKYQIVLALMKDKRDYDADLLFLVDLFKAVSLGDEKGLALLAGEKAVKGKKFSSGGAPKKGKEYEPKASIRKICAEIESEKFDEVLDILRDAERCADLYESTIDPIGVLFTGVDKDAEVISYLPRGVLPDNPKKITFKRLRDILTEIKK